MDGLPLWNACMLGLVHCLLQLACAPFSCSSLSLYPTEPHPTEFLLIYKKSKPWRFEFLAFAPFKISRSVELPSDPFSRGVRVMGRRSPTRERRKQEFEPLEMKMRGASVQASILDGPKCYAMWLAIPSSTRRHIKARLRARIRRVEGKGVSWDRASY